MFKIGEFSRFSQVSVKTLRYYDQIGLLKPAEVDRFTGYRYYSADQLPRINRILALKDLGLSLDQIAQLLKENLTPEQIRGILRLKQVEIQQRVQEEGARLARVEWRLKQIEREETMPTQEVVLKKVPPIVVASVRDTVPTTGIGQLFGEIFAHLGQHTVNPAGPTMGIYYDEEFHEEAVDIEAAVPVSGPLPGGERVKCRDLPAVEEAACIFHPGTFDTLAGTYGQLMAWVEANGYRMAGPIREVYVQWAEPGGDPSTNVTEIQLPVAKV
jgi:DNA-binding transcriptional MerR regulator